MKRSEWAIAVFVLAAYAAWRGEALMGPFILPFETAFQEAIALTHLERGFMADRFLPVLAYMDGQNFYHTAHPPLLHIVYAALYKIFGVHEPVTRLFSLLLYFGAAALWRNFLGPDEKRAWVVFAAAFFLPLPFILCTTTNYEPLSIFMVSLIAYLVMAEGAGLKTLIPVVTAGTLVDWPVYLAVPSLAVLYWRDKETRKRLLVLFGWETFCFLALQAYQYGAAGEAAFFSHAPERANPFALFRALTYASLGFHFLEVMGTAGTIAALAATLAAAGSIVSAVRGKKGLWGDPAAKAAAFFGLFFLVLLASAPGLVSRHYVYLLYLAPFLCLAVHIGLRRAGAFHLALIGLFLMLLPQNYLAAGHRNPAYFTLARMDFGKGRIKTAFSSAAVGAYKFYGGVETLFPMSVASARWLESHDPDLIHLDLRHEEVLGLKDLGRERPGYRLAAEFGGERVYVRDGLVEDRGRIMVLPESSSAGPGLAFILPGRKRACLVSAGLESGKPSWIEDPASGKCVEPVHAVGLHPREGGAWAQARVPNGFDLASFKPAIVHSHPFAESDGVNFTAFAVYDIEGGPGKTSLLYARFVPEGGAAAVRKTAVSLEGSSMLVFRTDPGPRGNLNFDDAYWLEPYFYGR